MFSQEVSASFCYRLLLSEQRHPLSNLKKIPHTHLSGVVLLYTRLERLVLNSIHIELYVDWSSRCDIFFTG